MSEQPASTPPAMAARTRTPTARRTDLILDRDHIGDSFWKIEDMTDIGLPLADSHADVSRRDLGLAHEKEIDVVCRQRVVERRLDRGPGRDRPHQMRRDDDRQI